MQRFIIRTGPVNQAYAATIQDFGEPTADMVSQFYRTGIWIVIYPHPVKFVEKFHALFN